VNRIFQFSYYTNHIKYTHTRAHLFDGSTHDVAISRRKMSQYTTSIDSLPPKRIMLQSSTNSRSATASCLFYFLSPPPRTSRFISIGQFINRIVEKLLSQRSQYLVERWNTSHGGNHWILVV